jgi:DNA-binding beta-propeller fold protein YncE
MHRFDRHLLGVLACVSSGAPLCAQGTLTNADIPRDDQKGRYLDFERAQLAPLVLSGNGSRLYTLNSPGARVEVVDTASDARLYEIPIGIGAVSLARRPGTEELWVVDEIASTVCVIDPQLARIERSIRVGAQPHGIAFTDSGDRAYVSCSAANRVDVIWAASGTVVNSIAIPARDPRGIVWQGGRAWLVSFTSGNNTAPIGAPGNPGKVVGVKRVSGAGLVPLPDRDLFAIVTQPNPALDALDPGSTRSGLGTTLFNVCPRPGTSELWILNTDALNADHRGEKNFVAGQVVSNRISVVDTSNNQPPVVIDLDALAPLGAKCAQPSSVVFDPNGTRAYVTGFGSDLVAVLDLQPGPQAVWAGVVTLPPKQFYPRGTGPRAALLAPGGTKLYVYERVDNSVTPVDLAALPSGGNFVYGAGLPFTLGFEGVTEEERLGRHLFANANFSKSLTSSCASCHIDGHLDGLAWDLGNFLDPEGTPDDQLAYPLDDKAALVTQSTRRMQDQAPYHWRGEKHGINDFQNAFVTLLENQVNGQPALIGPDFQYLRHYLNRLVYPPNPRAALDRGYSAAALAGANVFLQQPVLGSLTCSACHQLPLGTGGDLVTQVADGVIGSADVPALRGVGDKGAPAFTIGGDFGQRTELGAGWTHGGAAATLHDAVLRVDPQTGQPIFNLTAQQADQLVAFLQEFDSGLAPATGVIATANAGNAATFLATDLAFLESQARRGNCDLVFYRSPRLAAGVAPLQIRGRFDPATGKFQPALRSAPQVSDSVLIAEAAAGWPVTFVGLPLGMGTTFGLDRDCDGLWDLDEQRRGTDPENWDSDNDGFPDGYEADWGMNPLVPDTSSPDTKAPVLLAPAHLVWASTNTLKFEFDTTEMTKIWLSYNGGHVVQRLPLGPPAYDTHHDVVLDGLDPNTTIQVQLLMRDPSNNATIDTSTVFHTRPRVLGDPAALGPIGLTILPGLPANQLQADVALVRGGQPAGAGYGVHGALYQVLFGGTLVLLANNVQALTAANGTATLLLPLPGPQAPPGTLVFVVRDVVAPAGAAPYVLALDTQLFAGIAY